MIQQNKNVANRLLMLLLMIFFSLLFLLLGSRALRHSNTNNTIILMHDGFVSVNFKDLVVTLKVDVITASDK